MSTTVVAAPPNPVRGLARWAAQHCPEGGCVLDLGAGEHASGDLRPLLARHPHLVGTDPDHAIKRNHALNECHRMTAEQIAREHPGRYDLVLTVFVLEHVERPREFAAACAGLLKPGGSWLAVTLNVHHYFGATAWAANRLGVQPALLRWLKGEAAAHDHRFPTRYRFNSRGRVVRLCRTAGFGCVDLRVYDAPDRYAWYLPESLAPLPAAYSRVAYRLGWPGIMGHLSFRAQRC